MAFYSDDVVNEVFSENDIVDYVSQFVRLKKSGRDYSGLCPFHKEKSPSFHVSREKQLFHCFGCGASGNLVQFVMRSEGLDFVEALKLLAERAGINLPDDSVGAPSKSFETKKKIYEMNRLSARFFYDTLVKSPDGKIALSYFEERKISAKTITQYGLGYAPDSFSALHDHLLMHGFTEEEMVEAGLCVLKNSRVFDKFVNRVMFPIIDLRGNVIGFGGRIIGKTDTPDGRKLPKYLNSAETLAFNKGKNLFSLNFAKKTSPFSIILAEGYMDVISVYQAGVTNVVASLGTALTESQAKLLMKYCSEILICYDTDEAGQAATIRAIETINSVGGRSRVITLKGSKDPDEYIKANGVVNFKKAISEAVASTEFRLSLLRKKYSLDSPEGKSMFVQEAAEVLKSINDAVEVDAYINQIATQTEVNKEAIYSEYKKVVASNASKEAGIERRNEPVKNNITALSEKSQKLIAAEKKLIYLMSSSKRYIDRVFEEFSTDDFSTDIHKKLAELIQTARKEERLIEASIILNEFSGDEIKDVSDIFYNLEEFADTDKAIEELINNIKIEKITEKLAQANETTVAAELVRELSELRRKK